MTLSDRDEMAELALKRVRESGAMRRHPPHAEHEPNDQRGRSAYCFGS